MYTLGHTHWNQTICCFFMLMHSFTDFTQCTRTKILGHTLHTSPDTNIDHSRLNFVRNLDDCHEARGTLSIDSVESSRVWDSGDKGRSTSHCRSAAGCQYCSYRDILDQRRVD